MGKKQPYYGKSMSINFPDFVHTMMGFVVQLWDIYGEIHAFPLWWH